MAAWWQCVLVLVLCSCNIAILCEAAKGEDNDPCSVEQAVRLDAPQENATCGYVEGRVQICEDGEWKNICDTQWTVEDAQVTCKSLNYTATGAQSRTRNQVSSGTSTKGLSCSGDERNTTQCSTAPGSSNNDDCNQAVSVLCFVDESRTSMAECVADTTTGSPGLVLSTSPTSSSAGGTTSPPPGSTPQPTTSGSNPTTSPLTETDQSKGFLSPPALYYIVGGLSAVILAIVLLVAVVIAICCCGCWSRKLSHTNPEQPEKAGQIQMPYSEESQKAKEQEALAHHQIQQSSAQPIYEAIHDGSSTDSQGSPCSKPLMSPNSGAEVYSTLNNSETYAQIQPHIAVREVLSTPVSNDPDPNTNYQVLNHGRTQSLKRNLPSRPQAVNPTALALVDGRVSERDLANQRSASSLSAGHSRSLPRNTGHHHHSNGSLPRSHPHTPRTPEQVQPQNLASEDRSNEETNFYHILEPPPQYGNLEQIDEYSQVPNSARSHTSTSSHSPPFSPKYSHHRYPDSHPPHHSPHPRSATLPSNSSSSPRSRTSSQSSNSPQTNRQTKSPQISRMNRLTDSPGSTRGPSSSPNISKVSNRLSGQSGHSDNNDIQSNFSERSATDTLV